jgi:hypothetical protein
MAEVIRFIRPQLRPHELERVAELAPPPPPCFAGREQWLEYLAWGMASEEPGHSPMRSSTETDGDGKLHRRRLFNTELNFCRDCERGVFKVRMEQAGRCRPAWLKAREWDTSQHPLLAEEVAPCV